jgi:hypothetical protein
MAFPDSADSASNPPLVQAILEPLLDDFQYWFQEAEHILTSAQGETLAIAERQTLLDQIRAAQQEVATARTLLLATEGNVGVEMEMIGQWHQLVGKCWQTARQVRQRPLAEE